MEKRGVGTHLRLRGGAGEPSERSTLRPSFNSRFKRLRPSPKLSNFLSETGDGGIPIPPVRPYFDWRAAKAATKSFFGGGAALDSGVKVGAGVLLLSSEDSEEPGEDMGDIGGS